MSDKKEAINVRNTRLFQSVLAKNCPMQKRSANMNISCDALIDSFLVIFDECSKDGMKKDIYVTYFVNKYKRLVAEIRSLRVSVNDFELKSVIGKGYFGEVRVVQEKVTGDVFAMKIINKSKTLKNASAALFEEERDILSSATSPWLVTLQYAFQDVQNLYLVMEYHPGGDLLSLLEREGGRLPVDQARFYLAETVLAIHDLHRMGYAHRDVKPENVLLDRLGHVKLADFGSAARLSPDGRVLTAMPAGTPDYIAPEVLQALEAETGKKPSYGIECDFWSLGVLAYALVFGSSPFSGPRTSVTYSKILTHQTSIPYPDSVSVTDSLKDLINSLLKPAPVRLDYHATRKHLFFLEVDFSTIHQSVPPAVPVVSSREDTSNFTRHDRQVAEPTLTPRESQKEFSGKQLPFIGFTYSVASNELEDTKAGEPAKQPADRRSQQDSLEALRKENQVLLAKLVEAQTKKGTDGSVERLERDRAALRNELATERQKNATLRKFIEDERQDRRQTEEKALMIARQGTQAQEREIKAVLAQWQAKVDELTDRLTGAHTLNNELTSRCDRAESEVQALRLEVEKFESSEKSYKDKISKAREFKRRSVTEFESRLNRIQNQEEKWQGKLSVEVAAKQSLQQELQDLMAKSSKSEAKWEEERGRMELNLREVFRQLQEAQAQAQVAQAQLADTTKLQTLQTRLTEERQETTKLRAKVASLETELSNTTHSFLEHESNGQREQLLELEKELRSVSDEKHQLQTVLQGMQEREKENKCKLTELEHILEALEREVGKLEKENTDLKKKALADPQTAKLSSEAEIQYQQKVIVLEQQIEKLEGQVERLREAAILEKQELRSAQSKLWKTEKELSDTKIDVRIARRETKTAEDELVKLQDELKSLRERQKKVQEERDAIKVVEGAKVEALRAQLKIKEVEVEQLKMFRAQTEKLADSHKLLEGDYNSLRQQMLTSEKHLAAAKKQVEALQTTVQTLTNEKSAVTATVEELRNRVSNLELNNSVLRETGKMLDEQLEDYEKFVEAQTEATENLKRENAILVKTVAQLESDLADVRAALSEEKSLRSKADALCAKQKNELSFQSEVAEELRTQLEFANGNADALSTRLMEKETLVRDLELDLAERDQDVRELQSEVIWLKEEITCKLSDLYRFKEENCRLNQELEEGARFADKLQDRIQELERVITELETFHRQREVKDDATKQQQNKLISFLQAKLQEDKKKKTFADKLFGPRRRDPPSPQTPLHTSPRNSPRPPIAKSTSDQLRKKIMNSPRKAAESPRTQQAMSQLVSSPASRLQRQMSLPRMHHKIPHRFKSQSISQTGKCVSCHDNVVRGSKASVCIHCSLVAHPKCGLTAPKTCGLPAEFAQHFAQEVQKSEKSVQSEKPAEEKEDTKGWVDLMLPGESTWKRRYLKVEGSEVLVYDTEPSRTDGPVLRWSLLKPGGQTLVSDRVTAQDLPSVAKQDLPFVIKVVSIPRTTCWPTETHYLLIRNSSDKTKWIAALQSAVTAGVPLNIGSSKFTHVFSGNSDWGFNCVEELNKRVVLLGTERGLFALQSSAPDAAPVQLHGVTVVHSLVLAPHINQVLMVAGEGHQLLSTDFRLLESNASAAACSTPGVATEVVELGNEDPVELIGVSTETQDGFVYLTAATEKHIHFLRWNAMANRFELVRYLPTLQPVRCLLHHADSVIVGTETFQRVSLKDFSVQEVLHRPGVSHSLLRLRSFPMQAVRFDHKEMLLCFREFGIFVDDNGQKARPDLKWAHVPKQFAYSAPFLYIIAASSVEILRLIPSPEAGSADDTVSIATTATISDTASVEIDSPRLLGVSSKSGGGVFVTNGADVVLVEAKKVCAEGLGSCASLNRITSEGQFSFTSSIVGSLDGDDSDEDATTRDNRIQHTEL